MVTVAALSQESWLEASSAKMLSGSCASASFQALESGRRLKRGEATPAGWHDMVRYALSGLEDKTYEVNKGKDKYLWR
jgi:hypothetical protein